LNDYVVWHGKKLEGIEGAKILIQNQLEGIKKIAEAGITVKVNTVLVPRINGNHIAAIAQAVAEAGADKYNIIPLIPTAKLKDEPAPNCAQIEEARRAAGEYIEIFLHCNHCRADAAGVPGKSEISKKLYRGAPAFEENFSHG
jgi:nitrogen fixation protein NifB